MNAEVREQPEVHVAYVRKMGPYGKETSQQAFSELTQWARPRGYLESGVMIGVAWDNPEVTSPEKCRTDACVSVPAGIDTSGQVALQKLRGGLYGVCHFEIQSNDFKQAWDDAFAWLVASGYECGDAPCYELFHRRGADHPEGKWIVDICIPLRSDQ
jgi:AraC family transcriptional regulator